MPPPYSMNVNITLADGSAGVVQAPSQTVQGFVGPSPTGVIGQVVATKSLPTLQSAFQCGALMEAAGLVVQAGGVALAVRTTTTTNGLVNGSNQATSAISFFTGTLGTIVKVTYAAQTPHPLQSGDVVAIAGLTSTGLYLNGTWPITVVDSSNFTVPVTTSGAAANSGGTVQYTGCYAGNFAAQGLTAPTITSNAGGANDDLYPMAVCTQGFVVGSSTAVGALIVSVDAARNFGSPIYPGAATSIALKDSGGIDSGLTLNLGATGLAWSGGGIVNGSAVGSFVRASTTGPQSNDAAIAAGLSALVAYVNNAAAAFPIVQAVGNFSGSDATTFESGGSTNLDGMAAQSLFARMLISARDASPPLAWGGSGETEAAWVTSVLSGMNVTAKRVVGTGGHYNMPSAFPTLFAGVPAYRRPFSFALGARQSAIAPQRHAGRVGGLQGGALVQIRRSASDVNDGFVYHDEAANPAFDGYRAGATGRMASACTVPRKAGWFASNPLTLAPSGSDFQLLPRALVIDVACVIVATVLGNYVAADFTTKPNGTLTDSAANTISGDLSTAIRVNMLGVAMISGFAVNVDQTQNVNVTNKLQVTVTIQGVAYLLELDVTTGFTSVLSATPAS